MIDWNSATFLVAGAIAGSVGTLGVRTVLSNWRDAYASRRLCRAVQGGRAAPHIAREGNDKRPGRVIFARFGRKAG